MFDLLLFKMIDLIQKQLQILCLLPLEIYNHQKYYYTIFLSYSDFFDEKEINKS